MSNNVTTQPWRLLNDFGLLKRIYAFWSKGDPVGTGWPVRLVPSHPVGDWNWCIPTMNCFSHKKGSLFVLQWKSSPLFYAVVMNCDFRDKTNMLFDSVEKKRKDLYLLRSIIYCVAFSGFILWIVSNSWIERKSHILFAEQSFEGYHLLFIKVIRNLVLLQTYQNQYQWRAPMLLIKLKGINHWIFNNR